MTAEKRNARATSTFRDLEDSKTSKNEKFDNIYQGKFLIYKLRHDFNVVGKEHFMFIEAVKDSLKTKLPSSENPEIIDEGEQKVNESFYGQS